MKKGFTLIEILIVLGILAILAAIVIIAINPGQHFQDAREAKRRANVNTIMNAINQNMIANQGVFTCSDDSIPEDAAEIADDSVDATLVDICNCLVPTHVGAMPVEVDETAIVGCPAGYHHLCLICSESFCLS